MLAIGLSPARGQEIPSVTSNAAPRHSGFTRSLGYDQPDVQPEGQVVDPRIAQGESAFYRSCTDCHDAERAVSRSKSFSSWLATVRRMATKDGADIPAGDHEPIAAYLASVAGDGTSTGMDAGAAATTSLSATISPVYRSANHELTLENPGFFVDAWLEADWQPEGPLRGKVTACTSCHSDRNSSGGFTFELVEASATLDLTEMVCRTGLEVAGALTAALKAGRFVVPFGAFSTMVHPGVIRTVSNPLMFNMGRRVLGGLTPPLQPVLPAPFADEGVNLHVGAELPWCLTGTVDVYAVNGLRDPGPAIFNSSRRYVDNNRQTSLGGRATVGNDAFRFGGSAMYGNAASDGSAARYYQISGVDAIARAGERLRLYFEYALRRDDSGGPDENIVYGTVSELEYTFWDDPGLGLLVRYDTLEHRDTAFGDTSLDRFTWGLNITFRGGSLLVIDHEHWMFAGGTDVDVIAVRWTATF